MLQRQFVALKWSVLRSILYSIVMACSVSTPVRSGPFDGVVGFITDPLKLGSAGSDVRAAVERFALMAEGLQDKIDKDIQNRLADIEQILFDVHEGLLQTISVAGSETREVVSFTLAKLETTTRSMLDDVQKTALCTSEVTGQNIQENLAEALNSVGEPKLSLFGLPIIRGTWKPEDITDPQESFFLFLGRSQKFLDGLQPSDPASKMTRIYDEIRRQARITLCHYDPTFIGFEHLMETELEYRRRQVFWMDRVSALPRRAQ